MAVELTVTEAGGLDEVDPREWDRLAAGLSLFVSRPYLRSVENDGPAEPRYLLARDRRGHLVAALPCYLWRGEDAPALDHYDPLAMGGRWLLGGRTEALEWRPTLFVGTRSGYHNEWLVDRSWRDREGALACLLGAAHRLAKEADCATMAAMWLTPSAARELSACLGSPNRLLLAAASATIDISFDSFEGYLAGLGSSRRHMVRRELARFSTSGLAVSEARVRSSDNFC